MTLAAVRRSSRALRDKRIQSAEASAPPSARGQSSGSGGAHEAAQLRNTHSTKAAYPGFARMHAAMHGPSPAQATTHSVALAHVPQET